MHKRIIYDITPFTMVDYPPFTSCILWFAGCNMRCSYCYNPDIVLGKGKLSISETLTFLEQRIGLLDSVVLSGGECTMYPGLFSLCESIKKLGFKIKLDTNGSQPDTIKKLIKNKLIDFIALDFKAPPHKYSYLTKKKLFEAFESSLTHIKNSSTEYEVRCTYHSGLLNKNDIEEMRVLLANHNYTNPFYLQNFRSGAPTLSKINTQHVDISEEQFHKKKNQPCIQIR